jgi:methylmalonyl-CoA/ethylmalonyl-CoA epimerase
VDLVQIAQHADDVERATAFYTTLLGHGPAATYDPPGLAFFDLGGVRLMLSAGSSPATIYLRVDDIDAAVERMREHVESEPHIIFGHDDDTLGPAGTDEWQAFVRDTEGNLVGLVEHRSR